MQVNDLVIFQAVAEHSSFTKAAYVTNTVQSNVTARIRFLEDYFGAPLLRRTTRRIELTEAGLKLLKTSKQIQILLDDLKLSISETPILPKGPVKIGCIHTTAALRVLGILSKFTNDYPDMEFRIKTGTSADLVKDVLNFKLDGAFVAGGLDHPQLLETLAVIDEELCLVGSSRIKTIKDLKNIGKLLRLIVFNRGCSYRKHLEAIIRKWGIAKYRFIEVDTLDAIINTIEKGIGITLLPIELIQKNYQHRDLSVIELPKSKSRIKTVFIRRKDYPISQSYHLFLENLIEAYSSHG